MAKYVISTDVFSRISNKLNELTCTTPNENIMNFPIKSRSFPIINHPCRAENYELDESEDEDGEGEDDEEDINYFKWQETSVDTGVSYAVTPEQASSTPDHVLPSSFMIRRSSAVDGPVHTTEGLPSKETAQQGVYQPTQIASKSLLTPHIFNRRTRSITPYGFIHDTSSRSMLPTLFLNANDREINKNFRQISDRMLDNSSILGVQTLIEENYNRKQRFLDLVKLPSRTGHIRSTKRKQCHASDETEAKILKECLKDTDVILRNKINERNWKQPCKKDVCMDPCLKPRKQRCERVIEIQDTCGLTYRVVCRPICLAAAEDEERILKEQRDKINRDLEERRRKAEEKRIARQAEEDKLKREEEENRSRKEEEKRRQAAEKQAAKDEEAKRKREAEERARLEKEEMLCLEKEEQLRLKAIKDEELRLQRELEEKEKEHKAKEHQKRLEEERAEKEDQERLLVAEEKRKQEAAAKARLEKEEQVRTEKEIKLKESKDNESRMKKEAELRENERKAKEKQKLLEEEKARKEALEKSKKEEEERLRRERARKEEEERLRLLEKAKKEALDKKRLEEERARKEALDKAKKEEEERLRLKEKARKEQEERLLKERENKARLEAAEKLRRLEEERKRKDEEMTQKRKAAEKKQREEEDRKRREVEDKARKLAEAEANRKKENEKRLKALEEERKRKEAEEKARIAEEDRKRKEREDKIRREEEERRRKEQEDMKRRETEAKALKAEEERKKREEAERKRKQEAERKRIEEEARKKKEADEAARKADEERKKREDAERKRKDEAERKRIEEEARKKRAAEDAARKAEEERKKREEAERKRKNEEEERKKKAAEEAARKGEEERKKREEAERKRKEEAERKRIEEEEKKKKAAEEAARKAEEERKKREEAERKRKEEADRKRIEEEERKKKAAEEAARKAEEERRKREEAERKRKEEADRKRIEEEERKRKEAEEKARKAEEERKRREEEERKKREEAERKRIQEEERKRREAEEKARKEAEEKLKQEAERERKRIEAEEKARKKAEEKARIDAENERKRIEAEEKTRREAEEKARIAAEMKEKKEAEEKAKREEAELKRIAEEERKRQESEEQARIAEEKRRKAEEERLRKEEEKKIAEEKARLAAEEKAKQLAEANAKKEAEAMRKQEENELHKREVAEQKAAEREEKARRKADEKQKRDAEKEKRRLEEEERRRLKAEEKAKRMEANRLRKLEEAKRRAARREQLISKIKQSILDQLASIKRNNERWRFPAQHSLFIPGEAVPIYITKEQIEWLKLIFSKKPVIEKVPEMAAAPPPIDKPELPEDELSAGDRFAIDLKTVSRKLTLDPEIMSLLKEGSLECSTQTEDLDNKKEDQEENVVPFMQKENPLYEGMTREFVNTRKVNEEKLEIPLDSKALLSLKDLQKELSEASAERGDSTGYYRVPRLLVARLFSGMGDYHSYLETNEDYITNEDSQGSKKIAKKVAGLDGHKSSFENVAIKPAIADEDYDSNIKTKESGGDSQLMKSKLAQKERQKSIQFAKKNDDSVTTEEAAGGRRHVSTHKPQHSDSSAVNRGGKQMISKSNVDSTKNLTSTTDANAGFDATKPKNELVKLQHMNSFIQKQRQFENTGPSLWNWIFGGNKKNNETFDDNSPNTPTNTPITPHKVSRKKRDTLSTDIDEGKVNTDSTIELMKNLNTVRQRQLIANGRSWKWPFGILNDHKHINQSDTDVITENKGEGSNTDSDVFVKELPVSTSKGESANDTDIQKKTNDGVDKSKQDDIHKFKNPQTATDKVATNSKDLIQNLGQGETVSVPKLEAMKKEENPKSGVTSSYKEKCTERRPTPYAEGCSTNTDSTNTKNDTAYIKHHTNRLETQVNNIKDFVLKKQKQLLNTVPYQNKITSAVLADDSSLKDIKYTSAKNDKISKENIKNKGKVVENISDNDEWEYTSEAIAACRKSCLEKSHEYNKTSIENNPNYFSQLKSKQKHEQTTNEQYMIVTPEITNTYKTNKSARDDKSKCNQPCSFKQDLKNYGDNMFHGHVAINKIMTLNHSETIHSNIECDLLAKKDNYSKEEQKICGHLFSNVKQTFTPNICIDDIRKLITMPHKEEGHIKVDKETVITQATPYDACWVEKQLARHRRKRPPLELDIDGLLHKCKEKCVKASAKRQKLRDKWRRNVGRRMPQGYKEQAIMKLVKSFRQCDANYEEPKDVEIEPDPWELAGRKPQQFDISYALRQKMATGAESGDSLNIQNFMSNPNSIIDNNDKYNLDKLNIKNKFDIDDIIKRKHVYGCYNSKIKLYNSSNICRLIEPVKSINKEKLNFILKEMDTFCCNDHMIGQDRTDRTDNKNWSKSIKRDNNIEIIKEVSKNIASSSIDNVQAQKQKDDYSKTIEEIIDEEQLDKVSCILNYPSVEAPMKEGENYSIKLENICSESTDADASLSKSVCEELISPSDNTINSKVIRTLKGNNVRSLSLITSVSTTKTTDNEITPITKNNVQEVLKDNINKNYFNKTISSEPPAISLIRHGRSHELRRSVAQQFGDMMMCYRWDGNCLNKTAKSKNKKNFILINKMIKNHKSTTTYNLDKKSNMNNTSNLSLVRPIPPSQKVQSQSDLITRVQTKNLDETDKENVLVLSGLSDIHITDNIFFEPSSKTKEEKVTIKQHTHMNKKIKTSKVPDYFCKTIDTNIEKGYTNTTWNDVDDGNTIHFKDEGEHKFEILAYINTREENKLKTTSNKKEPLAMQSKMADSTEGIIFVSRKEKERHLADSSIENIYQDKTGMGHTPLYIHDILSVEKAIPSVTGDATNNSDWAPQRPNLVNEELKSTVASEINHKRTVSLRDVIANNNTLTDSKDLTDKNHSEENISSVKSNKIVLNKPTRLNKVRRSVALQFGDMMMRSTQEKSVNSLSKTSITNIKKDFIAQNRIIKRKKAAGSCVYKSTKQNKKLIKRIPTPPSVTEESNLITKMLSKINLDAKEELDPWELTGFSKDSYKGKNASEPFLKNVTEPSTPEQTHNKMDIDLLLKDLDTLCDKMDLHPCQSRNKGVNFVTDTRCRDTEGVCSFRNEKVNVQLAEAKFRFGDVSSNRRYSPQFLKSPPNNSVRYCPYSSNSQRLKTNGNKSYKTNISDHTRESYTKYESENILTESLNNQIQSNCINEKLTQDVESETCRLESNTVMGKLSEIEDKQKYVQRYIDKHMLHFREKEHIPRIEDDIIYVNTDQCPKNATYDRNIKPAGESQSKIEKNNTHMSIDADGINANESLILKKQQSVISPTSSSIIEMLALDHQPSESYHDEQQNCIAFNDPQKEFSSINDYKPIGSHGSINDDETSQDQSCLGPFTNDTCSYAEDSLASASSSCSSLSDTRGGDSSHDRAWSRITDSHRAELGRAERRLEKQLLPTEGGLLDRVLKVLGQDPVRLRPPTALCDEPEIIDQLGTPSFVSSGKPNTWADILSR